MAHAAVGTAVQATVAVSSPKASALRKRELSIIERAVRSVTTLERLHGRPTIVRGTVLLGYHHRVNELDLTHEQAVQVLLYDLDNLTARLRRHTAKLTRLGEARVAVILHLGLVLTPEKLESMKDFWTALRIGDFERA